MGRNARHSVNLTTGERVGYSLFERSDQPCILIRFRTRDGKHPERSTGARTEKEAHKRADKIIADEYAVAPSEATSWDDVEQRLGERLKACGIRPTTAHYYALLLQSIRKFYGVTTGPADITAHMAKTWRDQYANGRYARSKKKDATRKGRSAHTVYTRLRALRALWDKWLIGSLHVCGVNPWTDVELPKRDKRPVRVATDEQIQHFYGWLEERFGAWRLPVLFLSVKAYTGCRLYDLCSVESAQLSEGRLIFPEDKTKGRKERKVPLPSDLYAELDRIKGYPYLWGAYPSELRERLKAKGYPTHQLKGFSPRRLFWWWETLFDGYNEAHPDRPKLTSHMFRKRAFTLAWNAGIDPRKASIAIGCHIDTMMRSYVALDEQQETDEVFNVFLGMAQNPTETPQKAVAVALEKTRVGKRTKDELRSAKA